MKKIIGLLTFAISFNLFAAELFCDISVNLNILSETNVSTILNSKTRIDALEGITAYVTEKEKSHFIVEAYLADYDMRIFGEGTIKDSEDRLVATAWGRDSIVDIECRLNSEAK